MQTMSVNNKIWQGAVCCVLCITHFLNQSKYFLHITVLICIDLQRTCAMAVTFHQQGKVALSAEDE